MDPAHTSIARHIAVLADCHIHPGGGPDFSPATLRAIGEADLIVTLGDMGDAAGLDRLAAIAPVVGVRGRDDAEDPRTAAVVRVVQVGAFVLGCVFDPVEAGLATDAEPFAAVPDFEARAAALFGEPIDALLFASTHAPEIGSVGDVLLVNPGSATLPAGQEDGVPGAFARLTVDGDELGAGIVLLA